MGTERYIDKKYEKVQDTKLVDYSEAAISKYRGTFLSIAKFQIKYDKFLQIVANWQTAQNSLFPSWSPEWHTERGGIPLTRWCEALVGILGGLVALHLSCRSTKTLRSRCAVS